MPDETDVLTYEISLNIQTGVQFGFAVQSMSPISCLLDDVVLVANIYDEVSIASQITTNFTMVRLLGVEI